MLLKQLARNFSQPSGARDIVMSLCLFNAQISPSLMHEDQKRIATPHVSFLATNSKTSKIISSKSLQSLRLIDLTLEEITTHHPEDAYNNAISLCGIRYYFPNTFSTAQNLEESTHPYLLYTSKSLTNLYTNLIFTKRYQLSIKTLLARPINNKRHLAKLIFN